MTYKFTKLIALVALAALMGCGLLPPPPADGIYHVSLLEGRSAPAKVTSQPAMVVDVPCEAPSTKPCVFVGAPGMFTIDGAIYRAAGCCGYCPGGHSIPRDIDLRAA